ncbi:PEGA domain-containing protein [Sorangium sp. So ce448]|uniref:PEGA domain-containing protein n=1 Tax=Sorangium sp. So ce448 TaxID=3133314 RepID=UPI003F60308F
MIPTMKKCPLLWGVSVSVVLAAQAAGAQQPAAPAVAGETDALTDKARQLYEEGRQAAAAGKWADAHASFLAAWAIKPHYQIASNLGVTCLKLGRHREAAEYLARYLREAPASKVKERQSAEASLREALSKVASVTAQVTPAGAEVTVDGAARGKAPLTDPIFLEPGKHDIGARLDGHEPATQSIVAIAGGKQTAVLQLNRTPAAGVLVQPGPAVLPPASGAVGSENRTRKALLLGGGIAAGAGVAAGVIFTVMANARASEAEDKKDELLRKGYSESSCHGMTMPGCKDLRDTVYAKVDLSNAAFWSFVAGGAIGAGTLVYGLVTRKPAEVAPGVRAAPLLGPSVAGLSLSGQF